MPASMCVGGGGRGKVGGGVVMCRTNLYRGGDGGCLHDVCRHICVQSKSAQAVGWWGGGGGREGMHACTESIGRHKLTLFPAAVTLW